MEVHLLHLYPAHLSHMECRHQCVLLITLSCAACVICCSINELQDQFGIDHSTTADKLPHIAASIAIMSVPGLIAWGADGAMRLFYPGMVSAAAASGRGSSSEGSSPGSLVLAAAGAAPGGAVAKAAPLVPFLNLSYGYLPLVSPLQCLYDCYCSCMLVWAARKAAYKVVTCTRRTGSSTMQHGFDTWLRHISGQHSYTEVLQWLHVVNQWVSGGVPFFEHSAKRPGIFAGFDKESHAGTMLTVCCAGVGCHAVLLPQAAAGGGWPHIAGHCSHIWP